MKFYDLLIKYLPVVKWSQEYRLSYLKNDIIAGLTVGVTLIPQALAYGSLAKLPPEYGLFASLWGPFIYFFFGTSKDLTLGPTAILCLLVAHYSEMTDIPDDYTYAVILALISGSIQLLLGLSKLGFLANYMSPTVVSGFASSAAITIAWGQVATLLGLKGISSIFFKSIYQVFKNIHKSNKSDFILGLCCLVTLLGFKVLCYYVTPRNSEKPVKGIKIIFKVIWFISICANIIVITCASGVSYALEFYNISHLSFTEKINGGLPNFEVPRFKIYNGTFLVKDTAQIFKDIEIGIPIIALIALVEAMAIGKSFARKNGYKIRSSQEFIAIGLTNVIGSFFKAFPATGSFSRTAINSQSSSKSPFSGIITGILVVLSLRFLTPYFAYIPKASLSAIIIVAVMFMTDFSYLFRIWNFNKYDFFTWIVTFILSISFGVEYGVLSGIAFSFFPIILNASQPKFESSECSSTFVGGYLWFPFCSRLMAMVERTDLDNHRYSVLNLLGVYSVDSAIINTIIDMGHDFRKRKKALIVIVDNVDIFGKLKVHEQPFLGMRCFMSLGDAKSFYDDGVGNDEFDGENMPLISHHYNIL